MRLICLYKTKQTKTVKVIHEGPCLPKRCKNMSPNIKYTTAVKLWGTWKNYLLFYSYNKTTICLNTCYLISEIVHRFWQIQRKLHNGNWVFNMIRTFFISIIYKSNGQSLEYSFDISKSCAFVSLWVIFVISNCKIHFALRMVIWNKENPRERKLEHH